MASKKKLPADPADYFVHNNISLEELANLYSGQPGCSLPTLKRRSTKEKWIDRRYQNDTQTILKTDQILTEKKAIKISNQVERLQNIRSLYGQEIEEVGYAVQLARQQGLIGLTVQDGEGFPNEFYKLAYKAGMAIYQKMQEQEAKLALLEAANVKQDDGKPKMPDYSYLDLHNMSDDDLLLFIADQYQPPKAE